MNDTNQTPILPKLKTFEELQRLGKSSLPDEPAGEELEGLNYGKSFLPLNMYGNIAQKVVMAMSRAYQVNPDLLAATMLMTIAEAANRKATIKHGNYINRPCLWLSVVAVSGFNKSEPMSKMLWPLESINKELIHDSSKAFYDWKSNGENGTPPSKRQIIISDSTPEKRNELLNNNGLILYRDEIYGFIKDLNRYNQSGEVETLLSIWSGKSFAVDRKTTRSFFVSDPFLCICGGIQPEMIQDAFGGKGFEGSGFLARWLFLWIADAKVPERINEEVISKDIENDWYSLIQDLWRMPEREYLLNNDASDLYQGYMKTTAEIMNDHGCDNDIRSMLAKMRIYLLRLALIIHLLRNGSNSSVYIDGYTMNAALKTCNSFEYWGRMTLYRLTNKDALKKISNADLIREIDNRYKIKNQSEFARIIGKSQQYISKILNYGV